MQVTLGGESGAVDGWPSAHARATFSCALRVGCARRGCVNGSGVGLKPDAFAIAGLPAQLIAEVVANLIHSEDCFPQPAKAESFCKHFTDGLKIAPAKSQLTEGSHSYYDMMPDDFFTSNMLPISMLGTTGVLALAFLRTIKDIANSDTMKANIIAVRHYSYVLSLTNRLSRVELPRLPLLTILQTTFGTQAA